MHQTMKPSTITEGSVCRHLDDVTIVIKTFEREDSIRMLVDSIVPVMQGEGFYGTSDFEDTEQYIAELHGRESRVAAALNKHANPHLAVPEGVMQTRPDGSIVIDARGTWLSRCRKAHSRRPMSSGMPI